MVGKALIAVSGEWFWGLFSGRFLVCSNFLVIRGLRRSLDFRAVSVGIGIPDRGRE